MMQIFPLHDSLTMKNTVEFDKKIKAKLKFCAQVKQENVSLIPSFLCGLL